MTRPNATNVNPALRARISAILAAYAADPVADALATVAEETARSYRAVGMTSFPAAYDRRDDVADAVALLGRPLTPDESDALVACIRAHLDAGMLGTT